MRGERLALTGSFYMLQIYDRVLSSRSIPTLIALSVLAISLYLFQGGLEIVRSQVLVRIASRLDRQLTTMTHDAVVRLRSFVGTQASPMQPLRDVDAIRTFFRAGTGGHPRYAVDAALPRLRVSAAPGTRLGHDRRRRVPDLAHRA